MDPLSAAHLKKEKKAPGEKLPALTPVPDGVEFGQRHEPVNTIPHKPNRRSRSTNAVNFSFARATKRLPAPRCASAIRIETEISHGQGATTSRLAVTTSEADFID